MSHPLSTLPPGCTRVERIGSATLFLGNVAGETVCDPFMGTGSTGVAAIRAGKRFFGIEQNERHFMTAADRISKAAAGKDER